VGAVDRTSVPLQTPDASGGDVPLEVRSPSPVGTLSFYVFGSLS